MMTRILTPLKAGDLALRVKLSWATGKPVPAGMEAIEVLSVAGDVVTWTNHKPSPFRGGARFESTSNRAELIALRALENTSEDSKAAAFQVAGAVDAEQSAGCESHPPRAHFHPHE